MGEAERASLGRVLLAMASLITLVLTLAAPKLASGNTSAPRVTYSADGQATAVLVRGTVVRTPALTRVRVVVQARAANRHAKWRTRASEVLRLTRHRTRFLLTWRGPTRPTLFDVRLLVIADGVVVHGSTKRVRAGDPATIYYSGEGQAGAADVNGDLITLVASSGVLGLAPTYNGLWTTGNCGTGNAVPSQSNIGGNPITELAGFSLGRLGPIYFLDAHPFWESQINYILLLDPGSAKDMFAPSCDSYPAIKPWVALGQWLANSPSHHLVVMAGPATHSDGFAGLDLYYLSQITPAERRQVMICYASSPDHPDFLDDADHGFGWMVGAPRPSACPSGTETVLATPPAPNEPQPAPTAPTPAPTTPTPTPANPAPSTPSPSPGASISLGWSTAHSSWVSMTVTGFPPGAYEYTCDFGSGGDATYSLTVTGDPETVDNGSTCYDTQSGDSVWVTIDGVTSNTIQVASASPPPPEGFVIDDSIYGGTWARTDPNNGAWYPHSTPPPNGAYWYPNGLGVAVSCAESAASYTAVIYGQDETWTWWAHVTDGKWVPTVVFSSVWSDGLPAGLSQC